MFCKKKLLESKKQSELLPHHSMEHNRLDHGKILQKITLIYVINIVFFRAIFYLKKKSQKLFSFWNNQLNSLKLPLFWDFDVLFSKKQKRCCETPYFKCNALPIQLDSKRCRWHSFWFLFKFYSQNSLYTFLETIFYKLRFWHYIYFFCMVKWQIHRIYQTNVKLIMIS